MSSDQRSLSVRRSCKESSTWKEKRTQAAENASLVGAFIMWGGSLEESKCPYLLKPEHVRAVVAAANKLYRVVRAEAQQRRNAAKGGGNRSRALSPERRSAIARHAAQTRWAQRPPAVPKE